MSDNKPITIQFFLPQGEPRGVRIADITMGMVQAMLVPRTRLPEAMSRPEFKKVGVYFLFGEPEQSARPMVYIGEAEECGKRIAQHNTGKDFWHTAVAVVSKTDSFTKAHAKYLEWYCIGKAKEAGRYALENGSKGSKPSVPEPMLADVMNGFETLNILVSAIGFPLFEPGPESTGPDVFILSGPHCSGRGTMVEDGFTVFAGSKCRKVIVPSAGKWLSGLRQELLGSGVIAPDGDGQLVFKADHTFKTPSGAADTLLGCSSNGWTAWKTKAGRTLAQEKRKPEEPIFEPLLKPTVPEVFILSGPHCDGRGTMVEGGFTVFADSKCRKEIVPSAGKWLSGLRQELLGSGVIAPDGDHQLVFKADHTFKTPSAAAVTLLGRSSNGWKEWKTRAGITLAQEKRKPEARVE